jgi:hypothetical protein
LSSARIPSFEHQRDLERDGHFHLCVLGKRVIPLDLGPELGTLQVDPAAKLGSDERLDRGLLMISLSCS